MTVSDLASLARVSREARTGTQIDPEVYRVAFLDGFCAFLLREEARHRDDCRRINDDLVVMLEAHPSMGAILEAAASTGGLIEAG